MKVNKLDFILYIKNGNFNGILYLIASLVFFIPISIVLVTDVTFSSSFTKISISTASFLVILAKLFTLIKKSKSDKSIPLDIGIIIGLFTAFMSFVLK